MALDLIKYLGKFGKAQSIGRRIAFWTEPLMLERQPVKQFSDCEICKNKSKSNNFNLCHLSSN